MKLKGTFAGTGFFGMRGATLALVSLFALIALSGCRSANVDLSESKGQLKVGSESARAGLWREAMFRFNRAVEIDPNNAMAYNNLGVAYESNGEFDKAREAYLNALRLDRGNPYIQKNYSRFSEFYQRFSKNDEKDEEGEDEKPENEKSEEKS